MSSPVIAERLAEQLSANAQELLRHVAHELAQSEAHERGLRMEIVRMKRKGWMLAKLSYDRVNFID